MTLQMNRNNINTNDNWEPFFADKQDIKDNHSKKGVIIKGSNVAII